MKRVLLAFAGTLTLLLSMNSYAENLQYEIDQHYLVIAQKVDPVKRQTQHTLQALDHQLALDIYRSAADALSEMDGDVALVSHNATSETAQAALTPVIMTELEKAQRQQERTKQQPCH